MAGKENFGFFEDWQPVDKPSTQGESLNAQFKLGLMNSETLSTGRMIQSSMVAKDNDIISPEQANELFPTDVPFADDISASEAAAIQAHQQGKRELEAIVAKGPKGLVASFLGFTAQVAGAAIDPIGILSGKALAGVGKSVLNATLAKAFIKAPIRRRILETSIEGALGNVASEMAFVIPSQVQEKEDVNISNNLMMAAVSGAFFPAVTGTIGAAYRGFKNLRLDDAEKAINMTEARVLGDKNPNLSDKEIELISNERGNTLKSEYEDLGALVEADAKQLAQASEAEFGEIQQRINENEQKMVDKASEMQDYEDNFNNAESLRQDSNSKANDIYNDPEANKRLDVIDDEPDISFREVLDEDIAQLDNLADDLKFEAEKSLAQFEAADAQLDSMTKAIHSCITGG